MWLNTYPSHEFHCDEDYRKSCEKALRENRQARAELGRDPYTGRVIKHRPLPANSQPLAERVQCADALDHVIEKYGLRAVILAISNVCAANGFDVCTQTISDVALGVEQQ